jgi:hypothetical protein
MLMALASRTNGSGPFSDLNKWETAVLPCLGDTAFVFYVHALTHTYTHVFTHTVINMLLGKIKFCMQLFLKVEQRKGDLRIPDAHSIPVSPHGTLHVHTPEFAACHPGGFGSDLDLPPSLHPASPSSQGWGDLSCWEGLRNWTLSFSIIYLKPFMSVFQKLF